MVEVSEYRMRLLEVQRRPVIDLTARAHRLLDVKIYLVLSFLQPEVSLIFTIIPTFVVVAHYILILPPFCALIISVL